MQRAVIVCGGPIVDYDFVKKYICSGDFITASDCGLRHLEPLGVKPDLIIGDFDSYNNPGLDVETIVLPTKKDDTDSVFAVNEAVKRGFKEILLIGAVGGRIDHSIANVSILLKLDSLNIKGMIVDDYSIIRIISGETAYVEYGCKYFSLLNITGVADGITIKNAKYELTDGKIDQEYQYAVSNEVLDGKTAEVTVKSGRLLLVEIIRE